MTTCALCSEATAERSSFCPSHRAKTQPRNIGRLPAPRPANAQIECPHCHTRGNVTTETVKVKRGISGGKATGAVMTFGLSMFATGLSRKETRIRLHCSTCTVTWLA
jgi:hypothetical protein